jgi:GNAT superfamily N-acetyltransferase
MSPGAVVTALAATSPRCAVPTGITVPDRAPSDWWPLAVGVASPTAAQRRVFSGGDQIGFGTARDENGKVIGIVRGAVIGDLLHIARLAIAPSHRRHGRATGLLAALADWGIGRGASRCTLQVAAQSWRDCQAWLSPTPWLPLLGARRQLSTGSRQPLAPVLKIE